MNRTSSSLSLWWTNGESGAGMPRKIPRVVLGLAVLALVAVAVFAVLSAVEPRASQGSAANIEVSYSVYAGSSRLVRASGREGMLGSGLASRGKIGLGRIDPLHGQVSVATVAASTTSYGASAARGREGMLTSGLAVRGKIGLGRIDPLHGQVSAASVTPSATSYAAYAARGREGMLGSGLASGRSDAESDAGYTHCAGDR
jgi:hypothetical protein